jgi:hypothetical protein
MATGRTVGKFFKFQISDSASTIRDIPVNTIGGVGITYDEIDVSALQQALKSFLSGQGSVKLTIGGPFSNAAAVGASTSSVTTPALSGSHTVLQPLNGGMTAKTFGVYLGIQAYWTPGDPVFGGVHSVLVSDYTVDAANMTYSANLVLAANRYNDPAWGTATLAATS